jgi:ParB family chromosome partitioning protein
MANVAEKIVLNRSRDIPFNQLVLSQSNIRRTKAGVSIEDLATDIAHRGLLQSLHVRPVLDAAGAETGMFEIPAGGRRFRALQLLVKQKRMVKTQPVPCIVKEDGLAEEDSLAENVHREALHPIDQFRAFQELRDKGLSEDDIAARFFVTAAVVKQRLRLASVSPKLLQIYAEDGMSLEQLMAFTVTTDQKRQTQVWDNVAHSYAKDPWTIRRQLTQNTVSSDDRRALFIGLDAYEAAGGYVLRDLFSENGDGWLQDMGLLDRLVSEKLKVEAETIAAEGWKWIDVAVEYPYGHTNGFGQIEGRPAGLSKKEQTRYQGLKDEYEKLEADYEDADELPDEVDARLGELEEAIEAFEKRPAIYKAGDMARAGVFLSLDEDGKLLVERGYERAEDSDDAGGEDASDGEQAAVRRAIITIGGDDADADEDDAIKPLPDRLLTELTAHRTLALRDALASAPYVALTALLHRLCIDTFYQASMHERCLQAQVQQVSMPIGQADLKDTIAAKAIAARHAALKADMPPRDADLWAWLSHLDDGKRSALLAHCVSFGVNALYERGDRYGCGPSQGAVTRRLAQADRIARAVGLDMVAAGWRPTVDNYLGRVTKTRILEAVREAKGEAAAQLIDHMKKGDMAKEAARLLDGANWLPEPLRTGEEIAVDEALPDFLAEDDSLDEDQTADDEPEPAHAVR